MKVKEGEEGREHGKEEKVGDGKGGKGGKREGKGYMLLPQTHAAIAAYDLLHLSFYDADVTKFKTKKHANISNQQHQY